MKTKHIVSVIVFSVLIAAIIIFIFSNSFASQEESAKQSGFFMELLRPVLNGDGHLDEEQYSHLVRKLAHFTEFFALGLCLSGLNFTIYAAGYGLHVFMTMFASLFVACIDEYIQFFNDRGSMVQDVLIDFGGAFAAILIAMILSFILRKKLGFYRK